MESLFTKKWSTLDYTKFVFPSVLSMLTITMYMVVDGIFISRFVGPLGLAAVNILMPLFGLCFGIGIMMAAGASAIVGIELGKKQTKQANEYFSLSFYFLLAAMVAIFIVVYGTGTERVSLMLGASPALLPYCVAYLQVFVFGIMAVLLQVFFEYFMRLDGNPMWAMYSSIAGGLTNLVLDYYLIVELDMGIRGAGIASSAGSIAAVGTGLFYFFYKARTLKLGRPSKDWKFLRDAMLNGSSEMVTELSSAVKTLVFNLVIIRYAKEDGVAAMAILMYLYYLLSSLHIGLSMGISPVLSVNFGGRNFEKIREVLRRTSTVALSASLAAFALGYWGNEVIIHFFTTDQAVASITQNGMKIIAFTFLINGINILASGFFTAMNNGKVSALISFLNSFVFTLGLVAVLPKIVGLDGVWASVPLAEFITMTISMFFLWKYKKVYIHPEADLSLHKQFSA